ncbi:membrane protein [Cutibacterium acnes JCM 18918]|nr:membrane protein [Cutibacterium acnes JCM 18918]
MITYALLDIRRLLRNTGGTIFTVLMPAGFYLIFGATQSYTDAAVAHGNVKATIMVSMAVYGAVLAVTTWDPTPLSNSSADGVVSWRSPR